MRTVLQKFSKRVFADPKQVPAELLTPRWFPLWLELFQHDFMPRTRAQSRIWAGIEYIAEQQKMLPRRKPRLSERIMAAAVQVSTDASR